MIGGNFEKYDGVDRKNIASVDADSGKLDQSFDPGAGTDAPIYTVITNSDGTGFNRGWFWFNRWNSGQWSCKIIQRVEQLTGPLILINWVRRLDSHILHILMKKMEIYVGGEFSPEVENDSKPFVKLNSNGELVSGYIPQTSPRNCCLCDCGEFFGRALITGKFPETLERKQKTLPC